MDAAKLRAGDQVQSPRGPARVVSLQSRHGDFEVFNLEVETAHAYLVGEVAAVVHNGAYSASGAAKNVDLASPARRKHILEGDATGGGHRPGLGKPGKSEFPKGWDDDRIIHEISDIATDPAAVRTAGRGGRTVVEGTRDGVQIRVIVEKDGSIVTGFPTNTPRNP